MDLKHMIEESHGTAKSKGWWEEVPNIAEKLALIHSEVSEALEDYRHSKSNDDLNLLYHETGGKPVGFPSELADIIIRVCDLVGYLGIDLETALKHKFEYNRSRPMRHGGKRAYHSLSKPV